jgi:hypothetical protein
MTNLVIPPVCTRPHLYSRLQIISPTQEITAQICKVLGCCVIQTDYEQRIVNNTKTVCVVTVSGKGIAD